MEFVSILRELWRRKRLLVPAVLLAALVAISSSYKLPSLEKRGLQLGAASSQILIDSPASTLVGGADANQLSTLATRARVYAQYLSSLEARDDISRASGIPARADLAQRAVQHRRRAQQLPGAAVGRPRQRHPQGGSGLPADLRRPGRRADHHRLGPGARRMSAIKLARASFVALKQYINRLQLQADKVPVKPLPKGAGPRRSPPMPASRCASSALPSAGRSAAATGSC